MDTELKSKEETKPHAELNSDLTSTDKTPQLDFLKLYNKTESEWKDSRDKVLSGSVLNLSQRVLSFSNDRSKLTHFFLQFLRAYLYFEIESYPIHFLKKTFSSKEKWNSEHKFTFCDVLNILWLELEAMESSKTQVKLKKDERTPITDKNKIKFKLINFVKSAMKTNLISSDNLEKALTIEAISDLQILEKNMHTKFLNLRKNSIRVYQNKFYLLHESSEGYCRLISTLMMSGKQEHASENSSDEKNRNFVRPPKTKVDCEMLKLVQTLIGKYDLAPERVADIVLDYIEEGRNNLLGLLSLFTKKLICHALGFKFRYYFGTSSGYSKEVPSALINLCSMLVSEGIVPIEMQYQNLSINDEKLVDVWNRYKENSKKEIENLKLDPINVDSKVKISFTMPKRKTSYPHFVCEKGHFDLPLFIKTSKLRVKTCNYCNIEKDYLGVCNKCNWTICVDCNHLDTKFRICNSMLKVDNYEGIEFFLNNLNREFVTSHPVFGNILCEKIRSVIAMSDKNKSEEIDYSSFSKVETYLGYLGIYLYRRKTTFITCCRYLSDILSKAKNKSDFEIIEKIQQLLRTSIVLAFSASESSFLLSGELWKILEQMEYPQRFQLYGWWLNESERLSDEIKFTAKASLLVSMRFRKMNLHKDDRTKTHSGKTILKFIQNVPVHVVDDLIKNIIHRGYEVVIKYLIESFKYVSELVFDIVVFCTLNILSDPIRNKLEETGAATAVWFQNLTEFITLFLAEYPVVDFRALISYITFSTEVGSTTNLFILERLLKELGSVNNIDPMQLSKEDEKSTSFPGVLKSLVLKKKGQISQYNNSERSLRSSILLFALTETILITPLIIKISQNIPSIFWKCDLDLGNNGVQILSYQHSICAKSFFSLVEFLNINLSKSEYISCIPKLDSLLNIYKLRVEEVFHLTRHILFEKLYLKKNFAEQNGISNTSFQKLESYFGSVLSKKNSQLTPKLYLTFWINDLSTMIPATKLEKLYQNAISTVSDEAKTRPQDKSGNDRESKPDSNFKQIKEKLEKELKDRMQANEKSSVLKLLEESNDSFVGKNIEDELIEHCIFPRLILSPYDAIYSSKFIFSVLRSKMNGVTFANVSKNLIEVLPSLILSSTVDEASNLGRFLRQYMQTSFNLCIKNKEKFEKLTDNNPCFQRGKAAFYTLDEFKHLLYRIHDRFFLIFAKILSTNAKQNLLRHSNTGITNTAFILKQMSPMFPKFNTHQVEIKRLARNVVDLIDDQNNLKTNLMSLLAIFEQNKETIRPENFSRIFRQHLSKQRMENIKKQLLSKQTETGSGTETEVSKTSIDEKVKKEEQSVVKSEDKESVEKHKSRKSSRIDRGLGTTMKRKSRDRSGKSHSIERYKSHKRRKRRTRHAE